MSRTERPHWPNLATMMFDLARRRSGQAKSQHYEGGAWRTMTWAEFARRSASVARGLRAAGVQAGDRVLLVSDSRPEVAIIEVALMAIRAVPVPGYTTNTPEDHAHLLLDSGARSAIVSSNALAERVLAGAGLIGGLELLICMEPGAHTQFGPLQADMAGPDDIAAEAQTIPPGALACLVYTSGTSGLPRGVMLPHRAILSNIHGVGTLAAGLQIDGSTYLSYLPLAHSYEHTVGQFVLPALGACVVYGRGVEHLAADFLTSRPTILTVVPRILSVIRGRMLLQIGRERPWKQRLFHHALAAGMRRIDGTSTLGDRFAHPIVDVLVRRSVRSRFGGRVVGMVSGGARLDPEVGRFFEALGLPVLQGYGQTEAGPVVSVNPPGRARNATVGPALPEVQVRIAEDGEILVRGELVMDGYWNQPAATAAALQDGWLHTGDVGVLDEDGYLTITDRKKDLIVLSGGENVSPARVEGLLMAEPEILQAVITGEGQAGLGALLVPEAGHDAATVAAAVSRVNAALSVTERIRRHALVPPFTIENGLLTPSQKIKRAAVMRMHRGALTG
jgi:long-chain acyl-CoA synthetase